MGVYFQLCLYRKQTYKRDQTHTFCNSEARLFTKDSTVTLESKEIKRQTKYEIEVH